MKFWKSKEPIIPHHPIPYIHIPKPKTGGVSMIKTTTLLEDKIAKRVSEAIEQGDYTIKMVETTRHCVHEPAIQTVLLRTNCGLEITINGYCQ